MRHNLPAFSTPFIGRADEIADLSQLLDDPNCRLLTLVGPGGIGKTRLAVEVARCKLDAFPDGVYFVPLQPLQAAGDVLPAIVDVLPLQVTANLKQELLDFLRDKRALLLLDNFEHLLDSAPLVSDILTAAMGVKVLVSTREVLTLMEEWPWPVDGLAYPGNGEANAAATYSAVDLFAYHAQRLSRDFSLEAEREHVIRICQHVGGLPLALELAASQTDVLSCKNLVARIEHDLDNLATDVHNMPDRHRSMRVVLDASWQQRSDSERVVIPKLSVFRGGFELEAAETIASACLPTLKALVRTSWLRMSAGRYEMQEVLREYAAAQLEAAGECEAAHDVHCRYYTDFLGQREPDIKGRRQIEAYQEIAVDFENVRAAWHWAVDHMDYRALDRGVETLYRYIFNNNNRPTSIIHELFGQAAATLAPQAHEAPNSTWGRIVVRSVFYSHDLSLTPQLDAALDLARQRGDVAEIGHALWAKAHLAIKRERFSESLALREQCLACYRQLDDPFYVADALIWIGTCQRSLGAVEQSIDSVRQSLDLRYAIGDVVGQYNGHYIRATLLLLSGEYDLADDEANRSFALRAQNTAAASRSDDPLSRSLWSVFGSEGAFVGYHAWHGQMALLRGDHDAARSHHQALLATGIDFAFVRVKDGANLFLGLFAVFEGDCQNGRDILAGVHEKPRAYSWLDVPLTAWGLALVHTDLSENIAAESWLLALLQDGLSLHSDMLLTLALPVAAVFATRKGRPQYAAELLSLAFNHPKSVTGWMENWPHLTCLRDQLETDLGVETYARAWEHGARLGLETTAADLLSRFGDDPETNQQQANDKLVEPLTERELEVLALLAQGRSNRQIAQTLVIAVGTVKRYVFTICQKLDADNRTHAVARARELGLL